MITEDKVTEIFCTVDELCKFFGAMMLKYIQKSYHCGYDGNSAISIPEKINICVINGRICRIYMERKSISMGRHIRLSIFYYLNQLLSNP
jgi:hypothetical protein